MADPKVAALEELETTWSLDDLARANAWMDMREAMERAARPPENKG